MDVNEMTRNDFDRLPWRDGFNSEVVFDTLIILPGRAKDKHSSGYRCMDFVAVRSNEAVCRLSGCSDVIHIDGIGGYGLNWLEKYHTVPKQTPVHSWNIDCLQKSGLLRMWCGEHNLTAGAALSSFELYASHRKKLKESQTQASNSPSLQRVRSKQ